MSWTKVKLGDLCVIEKGKTGIQKAISGEYPLVVTAEDRKSHNEYQFDDEAVIIPLVSGTGHGHASIKRLHFQSGKFALGSILCAVIPKDKTILNAEYLFRFLNLNKERELVDRMKGMANVTLPIKEIAKIEIPLPSLEVQIEFVKKYSLLETDSEDISYELEHQLDLIKQLRRSFLREVIQGKLIKSTNTKETGQQLLSKIKTKKAKLIAEKKLKKEKELPPITDKEIAFEIPEHWVWCRLGDIITLISGQDLIPSEYNETKNGIPYITGASHFKKDKLQISRWTPSPKSISIINDLLITCKGTIGSMAYNKIGNIHIARQIMSIRNTFEISLDYVKFFLDLHIDELIKKAKSLIPGISRDNVLQIKIPLPPLHEQKQIVAKLEELMAFCDNLEKSIKESQSYNDMLLQQVLREALQPKKETKVISIQSRKIEKPLQTILAGHIIALNNTTDFGRVKFQKLLFLTEYICKIDFDSNYIKKVAGPYDDVLIKSIESDFTRMRFFNVVQDKTDNKRVRYIALAGAKELEGLFLENFVDESLRINNTILKFRPLSWGECELIATLYAVWNNRIIKNEAITDELLYSDFMAWDKQKSKYHSVFHKWLFWMKDERIIPDGWGKYIDKPQ
jgi:type I restriction enzyme S subunit